MFKKLGFVFSFLFAACLYSTTGPAQAWQCNIDLPTQNLLVADFVSAAASTGGGIFNPKLMWVAIVDREGRLCTLVKNGDAWPGSRAIAIAKASTANDFSNAKLALSTANLYGAVLPGGSLFGLNNSNPYNPAFDDAQVRANGFVPGGIITFGGGVALYRGGVVIGGLGVSGDTACADHAVAFLARKLAFGHDMLVPPPNNDDIVFENPVIPGHFTHPHC
jgi:uncharacterized protein GlcG (DUF336 family)